MSNQGRGDRKAQKKRRRMNNAGIARQKEPVLMIDGNLTHYPVGFCQYYKGYLTNNMAERHKCLYRECPRFRAFTAEEI
jgi:hypothetical protein